MADRLLSALLRYWRVRRGLSQLDLALAADVSARHVSFLESGRSTPSEKMVLRLMAVLDVSLRDQNEVLRAAGYVARFPEPGFNEIPPAVELAINRMMRQQEPYPLTVLSIEYDIVRGNHAATTIFTHFLADSAQLTTPLNLFAMLFDPRLVRPYVENWEHVAHRMVARLHREALQRHTDARLWSLVDRVLAYPGVPSHWRQPDLSAHSESTLEIWLRRADIRIGFLTTMTVFSAPQQVTLDELRIESYFPLDDQTRSACELLAAR